nr:hypothetical protein GCM10010200_111850 [Actinomadura rugatobispora]
MASVDVAALLVRVVVGVTMVAHGCNHLWGGGGLAGTARWFGSLGMRPPRLHALLSGAGEIAAGAALVAGLLTPLACAFVIGTMVVAGVTAHRGNGFFVFKDGYEYVLVLAAASAALALLGPGAVLGRPADRCRRRPGRRAGGGDRGGRRGARRAGAARRDMAAGERRGGPGCGQLKTFR